MARAPRPEPQTIDDAREDGMVLGSHGWVRPAPEFQSAEGPWGDWDLEAPLDPIQED